MIIMNSTPSYDDPLFYFLTNKLKFSGNIMGLMALASSLAAILAIIFYKLFFKNVKFRSIIIFGSLLYFFFSFCAYILTSRMNIKLGISDQTLSIFSSSAISMIGEFLGMPLLSLACVKSPKNLEGTVYSFFMSAFNLGGIISYLMGSFMTKYFSVTSENFNYLPNMISICNILGLLPLFLFFCFDEKYFENNNINDIDDINYNKDDKLNENELNEKNEENDKEKFSDIFKENHIFSIHDKNYMVITSK
jgi:Na+/melibiose symporter-like transporter